MKHFKRNLNRLAALFISSTLLLSLPVWAEEWDGVPALEEATFDFDSVAEDVILSEDNLDWSEDVIPAEENLFDFTGDDLLMAAEDGGTVGSINIALPAIALSMYQTIKAGTDIPVIPSLVYGMIGINATGTNAAGEPADFSSSFSIANIFWAKAAAGTSAMPEKTTDTVFEEALYYLCLELDYTNVLPAAEITAGLAGTDMTGIVLPVAPGKLILAAPFDLTAAPSEEPQSLTSLDIAVPQEYMALFPIQALAEGTLPNGTPIPELALTVGSVNGSTEEAVCSLVTLGQPAFYEFPEGAQLETALQTPATGLFTASEYIFAIPVTSQLPISESFQITLASVPGILGYMPLPTAANTGYIYTSFAVAPAEVTPTPPAALPVIELEKDTYTYTGEEIHPVPTITYNGQTVPAEAYTVSYSEGCIDAGTYKVTATMIGDVPLAVETSFTIARKSVSKATVTITPKSITYGSIQIPTVSVVVKGRTLVQDKDYTLNLSAVEGVGPVTVTVKGIGNYKGSKTATFTIKKAAQSLKVTAKTLSVKKSALAKAKQTAAVSKIMTIEGAQGKLSFQKVSGSSALSIKASTGKLTIKKGTKKGTYKIKVKVTSAATDTYKKATKTVTLKVKVK